MEAYQLQQVKRQEEIALQAFMNQSVKATKGRKNPKPMYRKFSDFFDTQAEIDRVRAEYEPDYIKKSEVKINATEIFAKRVEEFHRLKKAGKIIPLKDRIERR